MTGVAGHEGRSSFQVVVGVDTHQDKHVAVAIDQHGVRLGEFHTPTTTRGYQNLERWSLGLGAVQAFGIEGTGSYGAGLARFLSSRGFTAVEVNRPDRATRYRKGKSDPTDAESAARSVLAGVADAIPKSGEGEVEMIRMLKSTKDSAVKARTQAFNQMKALIVTSPAQLRESLSGSTTAALVSVYRGFRHGRLDGPTAAAKHALRSLARRYHQLGNEIKDLEAELKRLTSAVAPGLVDSFGIGPDTAATLLVAAGSNPQRLRTEAAFRLPVRREPHTCFLRPDQPPSPRPQRPPSGQRGPPPRRNRQAASRRTNPGIHAPPNLRGDEQERGDPLPQTLRRPRGILHPAEHKPDSSNHLLTSIGASVATVIYPRYIRRTIHRVGYDPMDDGRRYSFQPPNVSRSIRPPGTL